jgi:hypothetical protein
MIHELACHFASVAAVKVRQMPNQYSDDMAKTICRAKSIKTSLIIAQSYFPVPHSI